MACCETDVNPERRRFAGDERSGLEPAPLGRRQRSPGHHGLAHDYTLAAQEGVTLVS